MRSTFPILIFCLYALSAVDATPFSKRTSAEVQQGNAKADKPFKFWSDDKSDDDVKDDKWSKDYDECAFHSVSVLVGTSTYVIPCLQGRSVVNLNGLIPTPMVTSSIASSSATEASSSAVSSSAVNAVKSSSAVDSSFSAASNSAPPSSSAASSSEESSVTDRTTTTDTTTTTTDSTTYTTTTTTDTTTSANSEPTFTLTLYDFTDCTGLPIIISENSGCFNLRIYDLTFSAGSTSTAELKIDFFFAPNCVGNSTYSTQISPGTCDQDLSVAGFSTASYFVTTV